MTFGNNGISMHPPETRPSLFFKSLPKWIALVLLCVWMFVLGIIVGRETDPVMLDSGKDISKELAGMNKTHMEEEINKIRADVDFHEALIETGDVADVPVMPPGDPSDDAEKPPKKRSLPEKTPLFTKTAPGIVKPKTVSPDKPRPKAAQPPPEPHEPTAAPPEESTPESPGQKKMTIQIASFKDPVAAQKRVEELRGKGYEAFRSPGIVPGKGVWHRVRIGYFNTRADAASTIDRLKNDKLNGIFVNCEK